MSGAASAAGAVVQSAAKVSVRSGAKVAVQSAAAAAVRRHYELMYEPGTGRFGQAIDAQIAPDGQRVAFSGTIVDDLDSGSVTRLGLTDGGVARVLTSGPGDDHDPRWSPDGRTIAFLSDRLRRGRPQLFLLELSGDPAGDMVRGTAVVDGVVEYLAWSTDGRSILLGVADLFADQGDRAGPGFADGTSGDESATRPSWAPSVRDVTYDHRSRGIWIYDFTVDAVRRVTPPSLNVWEAAWCGPSSVVAVTSDGWTEGAWFDPELCLIALDDGRVRSLYRGPFQIGKPACSPSGERVALISGLCSDRGNVPGDIVIVEVDTGRVQRLDSSGADVTDLTWLDDQRVAFIGVRDLETVAGIVDATTPSTPAEEIWASPSSCGRHIARASFTSAGQMALVKDNYTEYQSITVVDRGIEHVELSLAPTGIDELRSTSGSVDAVAWTAPDGTPIQGWLCRPPGAGPHPLVLHVHGGPVGVATNAWNMGNDTTRLLVNHSYAVLHPNPRGSYGRGQAFVQGVLGDMGGADADDLLSGVDAMIERGVADPSRLVVVGTSYGGFMANLLPTRTDRFAAAVAMSPVTDWESFHYASNIPEFATLFLAGRRDGDARVARHARSPLTHALKGRTPTLEVGGLRDLCTPFEQASRFYESLAAAGTPARLVGYPEAAHGVQHLPAQMDLCTRVLEWLDEHVGVVRREDHRVATP